MKRYGILLLLALATLTLVPACAQLAAASPGDDGTIEIVMNEYSFSPNVIRLQAGQTVTIRLRNEGSKMHEFMAGNDIQIHENLTEGFGEGFFAGIDVEINGPGMVMGMEGEGMEMDMGGMEMGMGGEEMDMGEEDHEGERDEHEEEIEMGEEEMEMSGEDMDMVEEDHEDEAGEHDEEMEMEEGEMDMSGEDMEMDEDEHEDEAGEHDEEMEMGEDGHEEEGAEHQDEARNHQDEGEEHEEEGIVAGHFGAVQLPLMDAHAGLMVMIDPQMIPAGEVTTITFTIPEEKVGTWEIGCFQERGQHYDDGMNGLIIVES